MFPLWSVGEGTNFENAFFFLKIWCTILEVFRPAGATHLTDVNEIWQDERDWSSLNWPNLVLLIIFGGYTAPTNILRSNRNMAICYVDDTSLRRNARSVMHCLLANAYVFLVFICPIAIAYSMGQIIKSVCVCQCVCPSASTLTVAFLDRFSLKLAQT